MTDPDLTRQAVALTESVDTLGQTVAELAGRLRRSRIALAWTVAGLTLDLLLSVALGFVAVQAKNASDTADTNTTNARLACEAGNQGRETQIQLWTYVLNLAAQGAAEPTPAQAKQIAEFRAYISRVFAPRDCNNPVSPTSAPPVTPTR